MEQQESTPQQPPPEEPKETEKVTPAPVETPVEPPPKKKAGRPKKDPNAPKAAYKKREPKPKEPPKPNEVPVQQLKEPEPVDEPFSADDYALNLQKLAKEIKEPVIEDDKEEDVGKDTKSVSRYAISKPEKDRKTPSPKEADTSQDGQHDKGDTPKDSDHADPPKSKDSGAKTDGDDSKLQEVPRGEQKDVQSGTDARDNKGGDPDPTPAKSDEMATSNVHKGTEVQPSRSHRKRKSDLPDEEERPSRRSKSKGGPSTRELPPDDVPDTRRHRHSSKSHRKSSLQGAEGGLQSHKIDEMQKQLDRYKELVDYEEQKRKKRKAKKGRLSYTYEEPPEKTFDYSYVPNRSIRQGWDE